MKNKLTNIGTEQKNYCPERNASKSNVPENKVPGKYVPRKVSTAKKFWAFIGIFIVCLVVSMPFYSANVLATSLSITENYGTDNYDGYLDAEGDTWTLIASITNYNEGGDIKPEQVFLDVSGSQIPFSSCSGDSLETTCEFQSVLEDGISEGTYPFAVRLYDLKEDPNNENITELGSELASDTDSITADGSEPNIVFTDIYQTGGEIYLDFTVTDQPSGLCAGLAEIEILDSDTGSVLESISLSENQWLGVCEFDYVNDGDNAGLLDAGMSGEGRRYFKIRATDFLGHTRTSSAKSFDTDFVAPQPISGSLALLDFNEYVGTYTQVTDVAVNITECIELEEVVATSEYMEFHSQVADCDEIDDDLCIWECVWDSITVNPSGSSISADIVAMDKAGNIGSGTLTAAFTSDNAGPVVSFLGTEYLYNEKSYLAASGQNKIYLVVEESGAGIDEETVAANLKAVNGDEFDNPDECYETSSTTYECYWTVSSPGEQGVTTTKEINIRFLEDKVGNEGDLLAQEIVVDGVDPIINEVELYGFSAVGKKDYFQSNDDLIIELNVRETSGLVMYVDVNDIVMDAENKFMYGEIDDETDEYVPSEFDGWMIFDEQSCERDPESYWECELRVDSIKSGHDSKADLELYITDTAGNEAEWNQIIDDVENGAGSRGDYDIEIFALDEETHPDLWEVSHVRTLDTEGLVDLDIVELYPARIAMDVILRSYTDAKVLLIELGECTPEESGAPELSRSVLVGGISSVPDSTPHANIILEFSPFDPTTIVDFAGGEIEQEYFETEEVNYICTLNIYSVVDDTALNFAETQEVIVPVPFGYTDLGSLDENVDSYVYDLTHTKNFKILDSIKILGKIVQWVRYLTPVITSLISIIQIVETIKEGQDELRSTTPGYAVATLLCNAESAGEVEMNKVVQKIGPFLEVFTCNPSGTNLGWYGQYQQGVIDTFNAIKYANIGGTGSVSLYDNIWISIAGLCIPGIIYNLEKLRQIYCYQAKCLITDVPAGVTTVTGCQKAFDILTCKYWWGELVGNFVPLTGINEFIVGSLKSMISNPLGLVNALVTIICGISFCALPSSGGKAAKVCNYIGIVFSFIDIIGNIVGMVQSYPSVQYDICKSIGVDRHYGEEEEETAESVTTEDIAGVAQGEGGEEAVA